MNRPLLNRLSVIYIKLKEGRYPNSRQLGEELGCSERTILRCLDILKDDYRVPMEYDHKRRGFYLTDLDFTLPFLKLAEGELLALFLGLNVLTAFHGTGLEQSVESLLNKLPLLLPDGISIDPELLGRSVSFSVDPPRGDLERVAENMSLLRQAVGDHRRVRFGYYAPSRDERTERNVDPCHLRYYEGAWYLIGFCHLRNDYRTFAVDRIEQLDPTGAIFEPRSDFSPETYFNEAWGLITSRDRYRVVARFDAYQARWMRGRAWHSTQKSQESEDGCLTLSFDLSDTIEIKRWLMQFGGHVEVLGPPELREEFAEEVVRLREIYGS